MQTRYRPLCFTCSSAILRLSTAPVPPVRFTIVLIFSSSMECTVWLRRSMACAGFGAVRPAGIVKPNSGSPNTVEM